MTMGMGLGLGLGRGGTAGFTPPSLARLIQWWTGGVENGSLNVVNDRLNGFDYANDYLTFDGVGDYVVVPNDADLSASDWELNVDFETPDSIAVDHNIFSQTDGTGTGRSWLYIESSGAELRSSLGGSSFVLVSGLQASTLYSCKLSYDAASHTLSVTVNEQSVGSFAKVMEAANGDFHIGMSKALSSPYKGAIKGVSLTGQFDLPFDEGSGDICYDSSGNENNGEIVTTSGLDVMWGQQTGLKVGDGLYINNNHLTLDGVGDHVDTGIILGADDFELYIECMGAEAGTSFVGVQDTGNANRLLIYVTGSSPETISVYYGGSNAVMVDFPVNLYGLNTIYLAREGLLLTATINGETQSVALTTNTASTTRSLYLFATNGDTVLFNMAAAAYGSSLSSGAKSFTYRFAEGSGATCFDASGNGNHGEIVTTSGLDEMWGLTGLTFDGVGDIADTDLYPKPGHGYHENEG